MTDADLRAWMSEHVRTYEQLESLLLVQRHPEREWDPRAVGEALRISAEAAADALGSLAASRLLATDAASRVFRYAPTTAEAGQAAERLARVYADDRVSVIELMTANAIERMRTGAMRAFADAFLVGRKKDG